MIFLNMSFVLPPMLLQETSGDTFSTAKPRCMGPDLVSAGLFQCLPPVNYSAG